MGGEPFLALNIAALPPQLPADIISEILRGGAEKAREAGAVVAGGHTVQDQEPKYGMVVLGFVQISHILKKNGLKPGDILFLSKPIGTGVIVTAMKADKIKPEEACETIDGMKHLNRDAAMLARKYQARSATDITGFGLLGHTWEMASASGTGLQLSFDSIPFYPHAEQLASEWCFPGGCFTNAEFFGPHVKFDPRIKRDSQMLLFDPQTSGGMLFALPPEQANLCEKEAVINNIPLWRIGEVTSTNYIKVK